MSVQSARYISLELTDAVHIAVVPLVGVPRADRYHQVEQAIQLSDDAGVNVWLLYDERGILQDWLSHIDWLDGYLPVRSVQISKSASRIREELS